MYIHYCCTITFMMAPMKCLCNTGADPGFKIKGGALKIIAPSEARR